jgi:hypothetical protein
MTLLSTPIVDNPTPILVENIKNKHHKATLNNTSEADQSSRVPASFTLKNKDLTVIKSATIVLFIGMFFGEKVVDFFPLFPVDRLAISNLAQIYAFLRLLPVMVKILRRSDIFALILSIAGVGGAALHVSIAYNHDLQVFYLAYFTIISTFLLTFLRVSQISQGSATIIRGIAQATPIAVWIVLGRVVHEFVFLQSIGLGDGRQFGFDDNSHAAVTFGILAFTCMYSLKGPKKLLISAFVIAVSLSTIARLGVIFAGCYALMFIPEYRATLRRAKTLSSDILCRLSLLILPFSVIFIVLNSNSLFQSVQRTFAGGAAENLSTHARLELARMAFRIWVLSPLNMFLGITPGGFGGVAHGTGLDFSRHVATLHSIAEEIITGTGNFRGIPLHSFWITLPLEYPVWVTIAFVVFVIGIVFRLYKNRNWLFFFLAAALISSALFYSLHNEIYFLVGLVVLTAFSYDDPRPNDKIGVLNI